MPLVNFGSILNFAEELEGQDQAFYSLVATNPACSEYRDLFDQFAADAKKNIKHVQRTRRENVTEMILEPIKNFNREPFCEACEGADSMTAADVLKTAHRLEKRAERYYLEAAEKIKALPEVSRELKTLAKKRQAHIEKLAAV
ncbi:MAG: ferritin-like domain-containing protein [Desulfobacterales bacterium]|jgi:rubrerythrin